MRGVGDLDVVEPFPENLLDDCSLIFDPAEDLYEELDALSTTFEPEDEKVVQFCVNSATDGESVHDTISFGRYIQRPDTSNKKTTWKFLNSFEAGIRAKKKAGLIPEEGFTGFADMIVGRRVIKSEDHG